jgi:hypothetical protein
MPSYESSMQNLEKAHENWRPPRPWRSSEEGDMIRRFVFLWFTCRDPSRPSGRAWARQLGISHTFCLGLPQIPKVAFAAMCGGYRQGKVIPDSRNSAVRRSAP